MTFESAFISGDRHTFGLVGRDGAALYDADKLGDSGSDTPFAIFDDPTGNEFNATLSADGTKLAVGVFYVLPNNRFDSKLLLYDVPTKTLVKTITYGVVTDFAVSAGLGPIKFLPNGNRLMAVNRKQIELIDTTSLKDAKKLFTLPTKGPDIMSIEVSPDGTMIGTIEGSYRAQSVLRTAYLYDTKVGKKLQTMIHKELAQNSYQITFSSDSKQAVIRTVVGEMDVWDVASGKLEKTVVAPEHGTYFYNWLTLDHNIAVLPVRRFDSGYKPEVPSEVMFVNLNTGNRLKMLPLPLTERPAEFAFVAGNKVIIASSFVGLVWILVPKP
jgi:WD40 repeat protein